MLLLAWWIPAKGPFGALVVIVASFAPFLVLHRREARLYSLVMFLGAVAGMCTERWLDVPRRRHVVGVAVACALALFAHSTALAPAGLLLFVPGLRRDRAASTFRAVGAALEAEHVGGSTLRRERGWLATIAPGLRPSARDPG